MVMDHPTWYQCSVHQPHKQQPLRNLKLTDSFNIKVTAILRHYLPVDHPNIHPPIMDERPLFQTSIIIPCKLVFDLNHKDFLRKHLPNSTYASFLTYYCTHSIEKMSRQIIPELQRLYMKHASKRGSAKSSDSKRVQFGCDIHISVDMPVVNDEELLRREQELLLQEQVVKMVPASKEAVQSLKTFKLPQQCSICMEKFYGEEADDDDVEITPMPCGHVFHRPCILQWLQTSHMCPLCRCPLSIDNN